ncbi:hypothetical protein A9B99_06910 [Mangrovibacter phragmitis]|uniref:Uncharacterized protein n=1 Tax=Mangrovibacter phragmitis TaxID=1691903 RepID=A0A1B7L3V2_9ENTR|nr:hypothetical protein A9B99_06910 [Mangrovibacter phragmitis]
METTTLQVNGTVTAVTVICQQKTHKDIPGTEHTATQHNTNNPSLAAGTVRVRPVNLRKEDKVIPPGRRNKAKRGMDAESSRPQADCPEVNAVRSTGRPRKTGLLRGGPLNTFTGCEAALTTSLEVNGNSWFHCK